MTNRPRRALAAGLAAVLATTLFACSPGGGAQNVNLEVAVFGDADRAGRYEQALNLFLEGREGVTAELTFAASGAYYERLTTAAASGTLPDVFWLNSYQFNRYAASDSLLDLTPYLGNQIDISGLDESWLVEGQVDGATYGIVSHFGGFGTVYDKRMFDEVGLEYNAKTWEDAIELGRELQRRKEGVWGLEDVSMSGTNLGFTAFVRQHGEEVFTDDGQAGFSKETLVAWWDLWAKARADGVTPPPDVQIEHNTQVSTTGLLVKGQVGMRFAEANHASAWGRNRDYGLAIAPYPEIEGASPDWRTPASLLLHVASADTPAPEVAAELINHYLNNGEAAAITLITAGTPTPAKVREELMPKLEGSDQEVVAFLDQEQAFPSRRVPPAPEATQTVYDAINRFGEEVAYGRMTSEEAADALLAEAKSMLS